jgi:hypothetical protein
VPVKDPSGVATTGGSAQVKISWVRCRGMGAAIAPQVILALATGPVALASIVATVIVARSNRHHDLRLKHEESRIQLALDYEKALQEVTARLRLGVEESVS